MTHISQVLNESLLAEMVEGGYISCRSHPEFPYVIYNYTQKATFENKMVPHIPRQGLIYWNPRALRYRGFWPEGTCGTFPMPG